MILFRHLARRLDALNNVKEILNRCLSFDCEQEWFEFKQGTAVSKPDEIGIYISALSNAAVLANQPEAYLIWGVHNETHELTGTKFNYQKDINHEPFQHYLSRYISPSLFFRFAEDMIDGHRVVVLAISASKIVPTAYKDERWIRIGSSKERLKKYPEYEAALFRVLHVGLPDLLNTESRFKDLHFDQLFLYYELKGIKLNKRTFKQNLELLTPNGKYNMLAQLLSDNPHIPIRFAVFNGKDKASTMYAVREFGNMCIVMSLDKVLDFGDTLNVPQADERDRKVERKEVPLFSKTAFSEAVINAFVHNFWLNGDAPMFTAYEDRIEIISLGSLPPGQTKEGFFSGLSIPVNKKLSEIFLQLHISEKSGRGVPKIVREYGQHVF
ncbi:MAG: putative DNA binding domain-containing protein, partial [Clostridia bacterium]|nr:putative DNA binding domain-containing protein [Clostridia bacterium]